MLALMKHLMNRQIPLKFISLNRSHYEYYVTITDPFRLETKGQSKLKIADKKGL